MTSLPIPDELVDALAETVAEKVAAKLREAAPPAGFLNVEQAAEHLATTPKRVYELKEKQAIQPHFDGKRLLFRADQLSAYVEGNE